MLRFLIHRLHTTTEDSPLPRRCEHVMLLPVSPTRDVPAAAPRS
jgi:hypothetical protein